MSRSARGVLLGAALGLTAGGIAAFSAWGLRSGAVDRSIGRDSAARPELSDLVAACAREPQRAIEARLTGGFSSAPAPSHARSQRSTASSPTVRIETTRIEKWAAVADSADGRAALGTALLIGGDRNSAVDTLEDAVRLDATSAWFQSDLAAALLARAAEEDRPDDLPRAVAASERALKADPALEEAWFNRALALDAIGLREEARAAWLDAVPRQGAEGWRAEAAARARALETPQAALELLGESPS